MPNSTKSKYSIFYIILIQLLLNVFLTNAAVIGRKERSTNTNVTGNVTSNNELDATVAHTTENVGSLSLESPSGVENITAKKSLQDLSTDEEDGKTSLGFDDNTVNLALDEEDTHSGKLDDKNDIITTTATVNGDTTSISPTAKTSLPNEEIFTIVETTTVSNKEIKLPTTTESLIVLKDESQKAEKYDSEKIKITDSNFLEVTSTTEKVSDNVTSGLIGIESATKDVVRSTVIEDIEKSTLKADIERSTFKEDEERSTLKEDVEISTVKKEETLTNLHFNEEESTIKPENEETTLASSNNDGTTRTSTRQAKTLTPVTLSFDQSTTMKTIEHSFKPVNDSGTEVSTEKQAQITLEKTLPPVTLSFDKLTTMKTIEHTLKSITDSGTEVSIENQAQTTPTPFKDEDITEKIDRLTSTLKSDNSTLFMTSTETSEENPMETTVFENPNLQENKNATPSSSTEKLGKFIASKIVDHLTSTLKSDSPTLFMTSTETLEDNPMETTVFENPHLQENRNATPSSTEKRGKFIANNFSSFNDLRLPNTSDVWALAGLKYAGKAKSSELQNSVETSDEKAINNSMVTKNLLDWSRVMETTHEIVTTPQFTTIQIPTFQTTTDKQLENEVDVHSTKIAVEMTTENEIVTDKNIENKDNLKESQTAKPPLDVTTETVIVTEKNENKESETQKESKSELEANTTLEPQPEPTTLEQKNTDHSMTDSDDIQSTTVNSLSEFKSREHELIEDNQVDVDSKEKTLPSRLTTTTTTTTTSTTPTPEIVTLKIETTNSPINSETIEEANTGTTSPKTLSILDFTTFTPFLTSAATTTTTTIPTTTEASLITPLNAFNMDDKTNEPPNMTSTPTQSQSSSSTVTQATLEPATILIATTTTATTTPANIIIAATTESQATTSHTPAINNKDNNTSNNNYNDYEVVNETTTKIADNSSVEAFEATTRVAPTWSSTSTVQIVSTTEVDKLDEIDVTTETNFENNNAYDIAITTVNNNFNIPPATRFTPTNSSILSTTTEINLDHIDPIRNISETAETSYESNVIDPLQGGAETSTTTKTTTTTTTESSQENIRMQSTGRVEVDSSSTTTTSTTTTTTPGYTDDSTITLQSISTKKEDVYSILPTIDTEFHVPKLNINDATTMIPGVGDFEGGHHIVEPPDAQETDVNVIIAISVSTVGIIALILLVAFLYVMRKRQKQMSYGQRCRPVSLDAYSLDNVSVLNSVRRKGATLRASKRSYGNVAFDDPSLRHNVLGTHELAKYVDKKSSIWDEFKEVPQIIARADEVPAGCEDKNRYANVIPLPETRVILHQQNNDEKSEYINANYVRGPKDNVNYYIACQAPLESTVTDFWRMIWEQNSRVIIMATDLIENGIDKCAEYLPPSVTLDNHTVFGDYQVTLKNREVKEKYAISTLMLKNTAEDESREITHYWYQWPETGVPTDEAAIIAMLLEARSSLKMYTIEHLDNKSDTIISDDNKSTKSEINGNDASEKPKPPPKDQGPLIIHCSPGTGRTGTILAIDIAMRCLEEPKRTVDIPQIVYSVRRGRASAVQTKEQYEFIYKVTHMYATKISNINNDN